MSYRLMSSTLLSFARATAGPDAGAHCKEAWVCVEEEWRIIFERGGEELLCRGTGDGIKRQDGYHDSLAKL